MNKENLNDFYKQNRFNQHLRERIDSYEPELSDSLWDRIEHDLVKKESRGKRMVWMVYVMAGLLLMSAAGLYYLSSENKKLADAVKNQAESQEVPVFEYEMPEAIIEIAPNGTGSHQSEIPPVQNPPAARATQEEFTPTETYAAEVHPSRVITNEAATDPATEVGQATLSTPQVSYLENVSVTPFFYRTKTTNTNFIKEDISTKGLIFPKVQPYIGLSSELGSTRQKLEGSHAYRFGFEHPLLYRSAGIKFGLLFRNGLYVESGLNYSNSGSNIWYDSLPRHLNPVPGPSVGDSLITGDFHVVNEQRWIDLPVHIGYRYRLNSKWAIHGQGGLTYSIINSYSGIEPNQSFSEMDQAGESVPQPFKNFWSMNMGLGVGYQLGKNWSLDIQGNYRRGLTDMNRESLPNHPNRRAEYLNAKLGIAYIFR